MIIASYNQIRQILNYFMGLQVEDLAYKVKSIIDIHMDSKKVGE